MCDNSSPEPSSKRLIKLSKSDIIKEDIKKECSVVVYLCIISAKRDEYFVGWCKAENFDERYEKLADKYGYVESIEQFEIKVSSCTASKDVRSINKEIFLRCKAIRDTVYKDFSDRMVRTSVCPKGRDFFTFMKDYSSIVSVEQYEAYFEIFNARYLPIMLGDAPTVFEEY